MKNQNPQEILNEILLRMKYDSSMTLSENKKILSEQPQMSPTQPFDLNMYYYDINGNRKKKESIINQIPTGAKEARALYPNAKSLNDLPTYRPTLNLSTKTQPTQKQAVTTKLPEFDYNKPKTSEDTKKFQDWLDIYYPTWYNNGKLNKGQGYGVFGPSTTNAWNNETIKMDWYNNGGTQKSFNKILQKYNLKYPFNFKNLDKSGKYISTDSYLTQQLYGQPSGEYEAFVEDLKNVKNEILKIDQDTYNRLFPIKPESKPIAKFDRPGVSYRDATTLVRPNMLSPEELAQNQEIAQKVAIRNKRVEYDSVVGKIELPGDAVVEYWDFLNDLNSYEKFKKNIIDLDGTSVNLFSFFRPEFKGIKSFKLSRKGVDLNFKLIVQNYGFQGFGILDPQGKPYYYNKWDFIKKTDWEEIGPDILNWGSVILAVLGPATWPLLLVSAGMDLYAAKMQAEQGDTAGSKLSALLAFTPFVGKLAVKVPTKTAQNLSRIFAAAKTEQEVLDIVSKLSKEELTTLKTIKELGDINTITKTAQNPEVKQAIKTSAKSVTGVKTPLILGRAGFEITSALASIKIMWPELKKQAEDSANRLQALQSVFLTLSKSTIFTEEESKELERIGTESLVNKKFADLKNEIDKGVKIYDQKINQLKEEINKKESSVVDEGYNNFLNYVASAKLFTETTLENIEKTGSIEKDESDKTSVKLLDPSASSTTSTTTTTTNTTSGKPKKGTQTTNTDGK